MGKAASTLFRRPAKNWNIEHRADQFLKNQEKPKVAPRHESTKDVIHHFVKENPNLLKEVKAKDENLAQMLKGLVVEPDKMGEVVAKTNSKRMLPVDRTKVVDPEFGYLEPETIRVGRCSIRQAMDFLSDHVNDPQASGSAEAIARRYKLDVHRVRQILLYFHVFNVHLPKRLQDTIATSSEGVASLPHGSSKTKSTDLKTENAKLQQPPLGDK